MNKSIRTTLGKIALAAATLSLTACFTQMLWVDDGLVGHADPVLRSDEDKVVEQDNVVAFARAKPDSKTLPANSLVMMGQKYWYALDPDQSSALAKILNSHLSQRFRINSYPTPVLSVTENRFELRVKDKNRFEVEEFCLLYPGNADMQEDAVLRRLGFQYYKFEGHKYPYVYMTCFDNIAGTIYRTPQGVQPDYRFEQSIPIVFIERTTVTEFSPANLLVKLAGTPIALAADVVTLPIQLLFMGMDGSNFK